MGRVHLISRFALAVAVWIGVSAGAFASDVQTLVRQGETFRVQGNILAAEQSFRAAVRAAQGELEQDYAWTALGVLQANEGLARAKDTLLNEALGVARAVGSEAIEHPFQVVALAYLARLIADEDDRLGDARDYAERAAVAAKLPLMRALAYSVVAEVDIAEGRVAQAQAAFDLAFQGIQAGPAGLAGDGMVLTLAEAAVAGAKTFPGLIPMAEQAVARAGASSDARIRAEAALLNADLTMARGGSAKTALKHTARALELAQPLGNERLVFRIAQRRGALADDMGDGALAARAYEAAFANLQLLRSKMFIGFDRSGESIYRREAGNFHQRYQRFLLDNAPRGGDGAQAILNKVITVAEDLKAIEMEEYFRAECRRSSTTVNLADADISPFGADTAVLYPIVFDTKIEILVVTRNVIHRMPAVDVDDDVMEGWIRTARSALEEPGSRHKPALQQIYDGIFRATFESQPMQGIRKIVYIPDGALRNVPLAALMDGDQFLLEKGYIVSSLLGITLNVSDTQTAQVRTFDPRNAKAMVAGTVTTPEVPDTPLVAVESEVQQVSKLFDALASYGDAYVNDGFSNVAAVSAAMQSRPYNVIHISSHAWFDGSSIDAFGGGGFIGLQEESMSVGDLVSALLARGVEYPNRRVDLVVLSACGTAADQTDRAPLGIAGAAYRSNVATIVATLWPVYDVSADRISRKFYLNLLDEGMGRAEALADAQRWFLQELTQQQGWQNQAWRHPRFWAPFLLIGEPDF